MTVETEAAPQHPPGRDAREERDPHHPNARSRSGHQSERRPALDGIRAVAVLAVVVYHLGGGSTSWLPGGFLGVDVFFVLSGYLITSLLVAELRRTGRVDLRNFWARRVRRLLPAAALVILATSGWTWWAAPPQTWPARRGDLLWTIGYLANWHFFAAGENYFAAYDGASPLRHMWSLAVEEQFYLVWPLLVAGGGAVAVLIRRRRRGSSGVRITTVARAAVVLGIAASVAVMALTYRSGDPGRAYYGTDARLHELLVGALGALLLRSRGGRDRQPRPVDGRRPGWLGAVAFVALLGAFALMSDALPFYYRGGALGVGVATLAVIVAVERAPQGRFAALLSWRPAVAVGRISYGVYLWHWPFIVWLPLPVGEGNWAIARTDLVRLVATMAAAGLSYRLVERPVLGGRVPWLRRSRPRLAIAAVLAVGLLVAGAETGTALPGAYARQLAGRSDVACPGETETRLVACLRGEGTATPGLLVLGDSTARALGPGLDAATAAQGTRWVQAAWHRCSATGLAVIPNGSPGLDLPARVCTAQAQAAVQNALDTYRPRLVVDTEFWTHHQSILDGERVLRPGTPEHAAALRAAYARLARQVTASGARLVFVELSPPGDSLGPVVAAGRPAGRSLVAPGGDDVPAFNQVLRDVAAAMPGVSTVSIDDLVCPAGRCPAVTDSTGTGATVIRTDGVHLSLDYSRRIGPEVLHRIEAAAGVTG
jgi:peptidoglycan/LPS O-acetylase OafA/YrhL